MRESHTAIIERNTTWRGEFATEPYEVAWASEAIFFVRVLTKENPPDMIFAHVQISPDGTHWCNESEILNISMMDFDGDLSFCRVKHFGGWLRLAGKIPEGASVTVIVYLTLKE